MLETSNTSGRRRPLTDHRLLHGAPVLAAFFSLVGLEQGSAAAGTVPDDDEDGSNGATTSGGGPQPLLFLATLMISGIASMRAFACIF